MGQKKITELTLRSNVNDDVNVPIDDGVQTYRTTGPQWRDYIRTAQNQPTDAMNYSLAASVGSNALTIALKDSLGNNPGSANPVNVAFRSATATDGKPVFASATASLSTVISSGSTAGHSDAFDSYLYVYALNNGGAIELAWSSRKWDEGVLQTTTVEGGAGGADSADVLYSTTARSNKAIRFLGRIKSNQTTAGTWAAAPLEISLMPSNREAYPGLYKSADVSTNSSAISSTTYTAFSNSPAWSFTPKLSGLYKLRMNAPIYSSSAGSYAFSRITCSSGSPIIVSEQTGFHYGNTGDRGTSHPLEYICYLTAGLTYVFDIEGSSSDGSNVYMYGGVDPNGHYHITAEFMG